MVKTIRAVILVFLFPAVSLADNIGQNTDVQNQSDAFAGAQINQTFQGSKPPPMMLPNPQTTYPTTTPLFGQWTRPSWEVYEALNAALSQLSEKPVMVTADIAENLSRDIPGNSEYVDVSFTPNLNFFRMGDYYCRPGRDRLCDPNFIHGTTTMIPIVDHIELRGGALLGFIQASTKNDVVANPSRMRTDVQLFVAKTLEIPDEVLNSQRIHILYLPQGSAVNGGYRTDGSTKGFWASLGGILNPASGALGGSYTSSEAQAMNAPQVGHQYLVFADWDNGPYINIDLRPKPPVEQAVAPEKAVNVVVNNYIGQTQTQESKTIPRTQNKPIHKKKVKKVCKTGYAINE